MGVKSKALPFLLWSNVLIPLTEGMSNLSFSRVNARITERQKDTRYKITTDWLQINCNQEETFAST